MFWNEDEIKELEGTAIHGTFPNLISFTHVLTVCSDKIGKQDVELNYFEKVDPIIKVNGLPSSLDTFLIQLEQVRHLQLQ